MARRASTTAIGSIVDADLSEVGAGKEGWLVSNPKLLTALDTHYVAIANKSIVIVTGWSSGESDRVRILPELSPIEAEYISAIEWLVFGDDVRGLAIGTSSGYLMVYSLEGRLVHRQRIYFARIIKLRVRGTKRDLQHDKSSEEVCVVLPGVIARFDGSDIQKLLQWSIRENQSQFWDQNQSEPVGTQDSHAKIPYQLWNVNKYGACADAAITGVMPPPLMEVQSSQRYYCAVTVGEDAVISAFRLSEDKSRSLVGAILSKVVPATFSTIASVTKLLWRSDSQTPKAKEEKIQSFARASPLTCLKDHPRKGEKLTLSPSGTLAAITDSLGRILLLDTQARVVVRLWKGYRDASCLFMEMLVNKDTASSSSNYYGAVKSDYCLCLAIHAPRKGIIEVWQMRTGPRLVSVPCSKGSKMLQPTYRYKLLSVLTRFGELLRWSMARLLLSRRNKNGVPSWMKWLLSPHSASKSFGRQLASWNMGGRILGVGHRNKSQVGASSRFLPSLGCLHGPKPGSISQFGLPLEKHSNMS